MRPMLIVEDQRSTRLGLKSVIERRFPGRYDIRLASNGAEALGILEHTRADIVLTDLLMPVLDGLTMLRKLEERGCRPAVMIVSGHDDFGAAKEAIRHNVKRFIQKPIDKEELFQGLELVERQLAEKEELEKRLQNQARRMRRFRESVVDQLLSHRPVSREELLELLPEIGLDWLVQGGVVVAMQPRNDAFGEQVCHWSKSISSGPWREEDHVEVTDPEGRRIVVVRDTGDFEPALPGGSPERAAGRSERFHGPEGLRAAYVQAVQALEWTFLRTEPGLEPWRPDMIRTESPPLPEDTIRKLGNMIGTAREQEMLRLLDDLLEPERLSAAGLPYIRRLGRALREQVFERAVRPDMKEAGEWLRLAGQVCDWQRYANVRTYGEAVREHLLRLQKAVREETSAGRKDPEMERALRYIHEFYRTDLSMTVVSNVASLNYSYFSQAFKEYTGFSFLNYLKKFRVARAKELLVGTDWKIHVVAARVGLENAKHFTKVFRELEGITPMEYRNRHPKNGLPDPKNEP